MSGPADQLPEILAQLDASIARIHAARNGYGSENTGPPPFPVDILPPMMRRYVEEAAASLPVPPEMIALPMMTMAGGLVGNRAHFQLKRGWYEYPTLYMVVVAGPGQNKSPAIKLARTPLQAIQRDAKRQHTTEYQTYEDERRRWKNTPQKERGDEPHPPKMRDVYTTDVTLEALAGMLEKTPGIIISSDELTGWIRRMNQYRQGGDREQYMSIWAGEPMKVDRKGSGSVYVDRPVVGVFGGIQPDVVPTLHSAAQVRDGFVDRILPFIPALPPKKWNKAAHVSEEAEVGVVALYRTIDTLPTVSSDDVGAPGIGIHMSLEAEQEWARWSDENNALAAELGGFLGGYYTKLEAHVARFALILHILWNPDDPRLMISVKTMRDAIALGEFFRGQMQLFLPLLVSGAKTSSKQAGLRGRILRLFHKKLGKSESGNVGNGETRICLSRRDLMDGLGNIKAEELTRELDTQISDGDISYERVPTATKPVDTYCLTITPEATVTESGLPTFPLSDIPTIASVNGSTEPVPSGCGAPDSCQKLGPCHVYREHGRCWSTRGKESV